MAFLIAQGITYKGWDSEKIIKRITLLRIIVILHYVLLNIQFLTFYAPSFGLLIRYVEEGQMEIIKIN